jgi:hypothetical protein
MGPNVSRDRLSRDLTQRDHRAIQALLRDLENPCQYPLRFWNCSVPVHPPEAVEQRVVVDRQMIPIVRKLTDLIACGPSAASDSASPRAHYR